VENKVERVVRWRMRWRECDEECEGSDVERVMWRGVLRGTDS